MYLLNINFLRQFFFLIVLKSYFKFYSKPAHFWKYGLAWTLGSTVASHNIYSRPISQPNVLLTETYSLKYSGFYSTKFDHNQPMIPACILNQSECQSNGVFEWWGKMAIKKNLLKYFFF